MDGGSISSLVVVLTSYNGLAFLASIAIFQFVEHLAFILLEFELC